jgi:nucleoside 2-deoxyribosyltransferase
MNQHSPRSKFVYLAGAIEYSPDGGEGWRRALIPFLRDELRWEVYDPTSGEAQLLTEEEAPVFRTWKREDLARFQSTMRRIIRHDLENLQRADLIICLWDRHVIRGGGTHGELTLAHHLGKPVHLVLQVPIEEVSSWILGCATEVHADFQALRKRLRGL